MRRFSVILFYFFFTANCFSQRIGLGVYVGKETNNIAFNSLYSFQTDVKKVSFNQATIYKNKFGITLNYSDEKRIQNQLEFGLTQMGGYNFILASNNKLNSGFYATGDYFGTWEKLIQYSQFRNKFSYKLIKINKFSIGAHIMFGGQFFLKKRMAQNYNRIGTNQVYLDGTDITPFDSLLQIDFYEKQISQLKNFITLDYGLDFSYNKLTLGISTGINITNLGTSTLFGRLNRIEVVCSYALFSAPFNYQLKKNNSYQKKETNSYSVSNSSHQLYFRIVQPVNHFINFNQSGIYVSGYDIDDDAVFGLNPTGYKDQLEYHVYAIRATPTFKLLPGIKIGSQVEINSSFFANLELGFSAVNMNFSNSLYVQDYSNYIDYDEKITTVNGSINDLTMKFRRYFFNANINYRLPLFKKAKLFVGSGINIGINGWKEQFQGVRFISSGILAPFFSPQLLSGIWESKMGIEKNSFAVEAQFELGLSNYFNNSTSIGFGRLQTFSVAVKIPIYKFSSK